MGTDAPIKKRYDIPIEAPQRTQAPRKTPLELPAADPDRWFTPTTPIKEPAKEPSRI